METPSQQEVRRPCALWQPAGTMPEMTAGCAAQASSLYPPSVPLCPYLHVQPSTFVACSETLRASPLPLVACSHGFQGLD